MILARNRIEVHLQSGLYKWIAILQETKHFSASQHLVGQQISENGDESWAPTLKISQHLKAWVLLVSLEVQGAERVPTADNISLLVLADQGKQRNKDYQNAYYLLWIRVLWPVEVIHGQCDSLSKYRCDYIVGEVVILSNRMILIRMQLLGFWQRLLGLESDVALWIYLAKWIRKKTPFSSKERFHASASTIQKSSGRRMEPLFWTKASLEPKIVREP